METLDDIDSYDLPGVGTVVTLEDARRVLHDLQAGYEQAEAGRLREIAYANAARKAERERLAELLDQPKHRKALDLAFDGFREAGDEIAAQAILSLQMQLQELRSRE